MKHVYTGRDEMDANFVRGLLEQEGIRAVVQGEALGEAWGTLPLSAESLPSVWIAEDKDEVGAAAIVARYRQVDRANATTDAEERRATWKCPNCGEAVEEQFTACWKCGHNRSGGPASME
jgi:predicted RNA-binding Zn-ribbon protein involved in translation (DUF1610 family)